MAKSNNQKMKILYLMRAFQNRTDEEHVLSMQDILDELAEHGISAERKSIYDDMDALRMFGLNICYRRARPSGYYLSGNEGVLQEEENVPKSPKKGSESLGESKKQENRTKQEIPGIWPVYQKRKEADKKMVKLLCSNRTYEEVKVCLGDAAEYKTKDADTFCASAKVYVDRYFFGWLASMGTDVKIMKPKKAQSAFREYLKTITKEYKKSEK